MIDSATQALKLANEIKASQVSKSTAEDVGEAMRATLERVADKRREDALELAIEILRAASQIERQSEIDRAPATRAQPSLGENKSKGLRLLALPVLPTVSASPKNCGKLGKIAMASLTCRLA